MTIDISPEAERVVREEIDSGHFRSVDELILSSVRAWRKHHLSRAQGRSRANGKEKARDFVIRGMESASDDQARERRSGP
jgi:Arc/MetJ-type ribon-helix-helix transcriptional regulator